MSCKSFNTLYRVRSENLKTIWRFMSRTGSECRHFLVNLLLNQNKLKYNFSLSKVSQKMLCFKATAIKRHKITVTKFYFQGQIFITLAWRNTENSILYKASIKLILQNNESFKVMIDFWMMVTKDESEEGLDIGNEKVLMEEGTTFITWCFQFFQNIV